MHTAVAAIRSLVTYVAIVLYIVLVGPAALVLARLSGSKRLMYAVGHGGVGLALRLAGIRYRIVGRENVPDRAVVYCSNHESNVDPAVLFQELDPMLHVLYKAELHRVPLMGMAFDIGGFVAVDRTDRRKSFASVDAAVASLGRGNSFLIFPEGTRSRTGELLPFKKGGFIMALQAQCAGGARRDQRRPRLDAEGQRHRAAGAGHGSNRSAGADRRPDRRRSRRAHRARAGRRAGPARPGLRMELIAVLGRTAAFSFAAGVNLYATVAMLGLAARFAWVDLPPQFEVFDNPWVIGVALALYAVEFFADKIPYVDTLWDVLHTAIRPLGGALIAVASLGDASPAVQGLAALAGGTLAAGSHLTKAGTRAVVNTSPEPVSNWLVSLAEDGFVIGLGLLALSYPVAALTVVAVLALLIVACAAALVRAIRRRFAQNSVPAAQLT